MAKEPTILVKQKDGTSVRMTLTDFRAWRAKQKANAQTPSDAAVSAPSSPSSQPASSPSEPEEALPMPTLDLDALSASPITPAAPKKSPPQKAQVPEDQPIAGMFIPPEEESEKAKEPSEEPEKPKEQPKEETAPVEAASPEEPSPEPPQPSPEKQEKKKEPVAIPEPKPSLAEQLYQQSQRQPASPAYNLKQSLAQGKQRAAAPVEGASKEELPAEPATPPATSAQPMPPTPQEKKPPLAAPLPSPAAAPVRTTPPITTARKTPLETVSTPPPRTGSMGPVDELAVFNMTDFRRLGGDPSEATAKLKKKFATLQDESYVVYLEGVEAWRQSPLYKQYQQVLVEAIGKGESLEAHMSTSADFTFADMQAIAELNSSLL